MHTNRVAIVTGCGSRIGIGAATARVLAQEGCTVVVTDVRSTAIANDRNEIRDADTSWHGIESLVAEISESGGEAIAQQLDVSEEADVQRVVDDVFARFGRIDILVNNAAAPHGKDRNQIEDVPLDAWERVMAINARGPFLMARAVTPHMRRAHWGRIISLSSDAVARAMPYRGAYTASKAAVVGLTKSLSIDLARDGITVNAVCPGSTKTARAISTARKEALDAEVGLQERAATIPMGRHAEPTEIAWLIAFLASEKSAYITGQAIGINGGAAGSL